MSPSRNDPCPCGSGLRYKRCCGTLPASAASPETARVPATLQVPNPQVPETLQAPETGALVEMINQGRLGEAENLARAFLRRFPNSGVLWKIVSVALLGQGKDALEALRKAAQLLPDDAEAHRNLGALLLDRGRLGEALPSLRRLLEIEPRDIQVLMATANALCALGRARESVALYQRAVDDRPALARGTQQSGKRLPRAGRMRGGRRLLPPGARDQTRRCGNAL